MALTMMRLRNLPKAGFSGVRTMCDVSDLPERHTRYLAGTATEFERSGTMNTYLLVDPSERQIYGYFSIGPGIRCAVGNPVFEVAHLFGVSEDIENTLVTYAMDIVRAFNDHVCHADISARCKKEQFGLFSNRGFTYRGDVPGGFIRMQYREFS